MTRDMLSKILNVLVQLKFTLVGTQGLNNILELLDLVKVNKIPGAFVEAGVWRGGASIWARAVMDFLEMKEPVYVCDSFGGLPEPTIKEDEGDTHYVFVELAVSLHSVKENFRYFPLIGKVKYIKGLFKDTMPKLRDKIKSISVLRVDADMYEGTMQVLENLYDKVSVGGFVIVDDYCLKRAKSAIDGFREKRGITTPLTRVNDCIHYWQKI